MQKQNKQKDKQKNLTLLLVHNLEFYTCNSQQACSVRWGDMNNVAHLNFVFVTDSYSAAISDYCLVCRR